MALHFADRYAVFVQEMQVLRLLLVLLVHAAALEEWCDGRVICSSESLEERVCLVSDSVLDLRKLAKDEIFLSNSRPTTMEVGAISVKNCQA